MVLGCAAIMNGSKQNLSFQTSPDAAQVEVIDGMGVSYGTCITPCNLDLKRKKEYKVIFTKPGFGTVEMALERGTNGWIWGNILLGGIIGLVVDLTSGAAYKLSPSDVSVTLSPTSVSEVPIVNEGLVIIDIDNLSPEERSLLTKLESFEIPSNH
jgi:hypothetical protein